MNPNNQKENPAGLKNRNDLLSQDKAKQARQAELEAMTGPELMAHIYRLKALIATVNPTRPTANPNN